MPADLVGGAYHLYDPTYTATGRVANATQGNVAVRTNLSFLGAGALLGSVLLTTKKTALAAIPVEWGDIISKVSVVGGETEGESGEVWTALYSGAEVGKKALLLGQSKSKTEVVTKEKVFTTELEKSILITTVNAPNGYIYAGINETAGTTPAKLVGVKIKTSAQAVLAATSPVFGGEVAQKSGTEAAAEWTVAAAEPVVLFYLQ